MKKIYNADSPVEIYDEHQGQKSLTYASLLIIVVTILLLFGLTMLYSTSYGIAGTKYFYQQLTWAVVGFCIGVFVLLFGHRRLTEYAMVWIMIATILLIIADFFFPAVKGAHRWIRINPGGFPLSIQPSEFAKLAIAIYISKFCADNVRFMNSYFSKQTPFRIALPCGMVLLFVLYGKDLGTTILLGTVIVIVMFAAGLRLIVILGPALIIAPAALLFIKCFDAERWSRIISYTDPEISQQADGYQLWNSLLALGSGSWFGIGFMDSRLKAKYLPESHTDFILSIVGEELGFFSLCMVIAAYMAFMYLGLKISINSRTRLGMLLGMAITVMITLQAIINIGVVSGGIPTKGMPAPFISYGGSNMLMCMISVSILLSIAFETVKPGFNDEIIDSIKHKFSFITRLWKK
jgi:cell division protein FtsW